MKVKEDVNFLPQRNSFIWPAFFFSPFPFDSFPLALIKWRRNREGKRNAGQMGILNERIMAALNIKMLWGAAVIILSFIIPSIIDVPFMFHVKELLPAKRLVYQGKDRLTDHQLFLLVDGQWLTFPFPFVHHQPLRGSIFYVGVNERGEEKTQDYQPSKRELRFEAWSLVVVFSSFPLS